MRTKHFTKILSIVLALSLALSAAASAAGSVMGDYLTGYETSGGAGMTLAKGIYWAGSDYRNENYIEYTANSAVKPMVVYGSKITNYGSFSAMSSLLEKQGYHVIAGINGDYYNMSTYEPIGLVIYEGALLSSDSGYNAVGFRADGSTIIGKPGMSASVSIGGADYTIKGVNKARNGVDFALLTSDFAPDTKSKTEGYDIICTPSADKLSMNCNVTLTVDEVVESGGAINIPDGKMMLSLAGTASEDKLAAVKSALPGDTINLTITSDTQWDDVQFAVGSLYKLVTNGVAETGLNKNLEPRSAVGVKADGTLVLYTVDGRQSGYSVGATMEMVANRLIELGCVEATIMDGGGSTSMNAIYLGDESISQINSSSGGSQRSVTNYIVLATQNAPTGTASQLAMYPLNSNLLVGAQRAFTVKAADQNGYAANVPAAVSYTVSGGIGTIDANGVFTATNDGVGTITASAVGAASASVTVRVVGTPGAISVKDEDTNKAVTSLKVKAGTAAKLSASAMWNHISLLGSDENFSWTATGDIGTIDAGGTFTAVNSVAEGSIIVAAGGKSVTIPVAVTMDTSFDDVKPTDWFYDAVEYVNEKGLITGTGQRQFSPHGNVTRATLVNILWRMAGSPVVTDAPGFSDVEEGQWYADSVLWAQTTGVVAGYSDGSFAPNANITREQMAVMIYNYQTLIKGQAEIAGSIDGFTDAQSVSPWAKTALTWCNAVNIVSGTTATTLTPQGTATRGECASMIQRYTKL